MFVWRTSIVTISLAGKRYKLAEVEKPVNQTYLQLETVLKDKNFSRATHVLLADSTKPSFKLGRGHDADLKIGDISVSRIHAQISVTPKGFILEDNTSKFGTLLLLPSGPHEIDSVNGLSVQIGRSMITFSIKQKDATKPGPTTNAIVEENKRAVSPAELASVAYFLVLWPDRDYENNSDNVSGDEAQRQSSPSTISIQAQKDGQSNVGAFPSPAKNV